MLKPMGRRYVETNDVIRHDALGDVTLIVKPCARRLIARWKNNRVALTVPYGLTERQVGDALEHMAPRLLAHRPAIAFFPGQEIRLDGFVIRIGSQSLAPDKVTVGACDSGALIGVGSRLDFASPSTAGLISRAMISAVKPHAHQILLPRARVLADGVGRHPVAWRISSGKRILGKCDAAGVIHLSYMNVFLPTELRDYIVWHELAHLSEMNHSPQFHALCDSYCGGREREFIARLRGFRWPLVR